MPTTLRGLVFAALTGRNGDVSGESGADLLSVLTALGGTSRKTRSGIDLTQAAKSAGVSRRTVERWVAGTQKPSGRSRAALTKRARQMATTKVGRRAALQRPRSSVRRPAPTAPNGTQPGGREPGAGGGRGDENQTSPGRSPGAAGDGEGRQGPGARLTIDAIQGPHESRYMRLRSTSLDLDGQDTDAMYAAWEEGGEKGFMTWATNHWGKDYVDDWRFGEISGITVESEIR